jgi:hypothetical protein
MVAFSILMQAHGVSTPLFGQFKIDFSNLIITVIRKWECGKLSAVG